MNKQIILTIVITFIVLFGTTFLLDIEIIRISITRSIIVYLLLIFELLFGFLILKTFVKL